MSGDNSTDGDDPAAGKPILTDGRIVYLKNVLARNPVTSAEEILTARATFRRLVFQNHRELEDRVYKQVETLRRNSALVRGNFWKTKPATLAKRTQLFRKQVEQLGLPIDAGRLETLAAHRSELAQFTSLSKDEQQFLSVMRQILSGSRLQQLEGKSQFESWLVHRQIRRPVTNFLKRFRQTAPQLATLEADWINRSIKQGEKWSFGFGNHPLHQSQPQESSGWRTAIIIIVVILSIVVRIAVSNQQKTNKSSTQSNQQPFNR
jgi:hypothetical protein